MVREIRPEPGGEIRLGTTNVLGCNHLWSFKYVARLSFSTAYEECIYLNLTMVYWTFIISATNIYWVLTQWLNLEGSIISNVYSIFYNNQWQGKELNDFFICPTIFLTTEYWQQLRFNRIQKEVIDVSFFFFQAKKKNNVALVGVMSHELGHVLGMPDVPYNTKCPSGSCVMNQYLRWDLVILGRKNMS